MPRISAEGFSEEVRSSAAALGQRLRAKRIELRISRDELAVRTGLSQWSIEAIEKGSPAASLGAYLEVMKVYDVLGSLDSVVPAAVLPEGPTRMRRTREELANATEDVPTRLKRFHKRMADQVETGERDARSLMIIPDKIAEEPVTFPPNPFGEPEDW